jgi:hypothetical protein
MIMHGSCDLKVSMMIEKGLIREWHEVRENPRSISWGLTDLGIYQNLLYVWGANPLFGRR